MKICVAAALADPRHRFKRCLLRRLHIDPFQTWRCYPLSTQSTDGAHQIVVDAMEKIEEVIQGLRHVAETLSRLLDVGTPQRM